MPRPILLALACCLAAPPAANALNPVTWMIDESFTPSDTVVNWTSPTAIDLGLANYAYSYEITKADAVLGIVPVSILGFLGDDVTGSGLGQLPAVLIDEAISETVLGSMISAHLFVEIGADGFATAVITDIDLPSSVTRVDFEATVNVEGFEFGDYDLDGLVNASDYDDWRMAYGQAGDGLLADGNFDGVVDAADYAVWRNHATAGAPLATSAAPEPSTLWLALAALAVRRRL